MLEDFELDRRLAPRRRGLGVSFQSLGIFESCSLETDERTLLWSPVQRCTPPVMAWKQRHRRKYLLPAPRAGRVGRAGRHGISSRTTRPRIRRRRQVAAVDATARGAPLAAVAGHGRPAGASARLHASLLPACCPPRRGPTAPQKKNRCVVGAPHARARAPHCSVGIVSLLPPPPSPTPIATGRGRPEAASAHVTPRRKSPRARTVRWPLGWPAGGSAATVRGRACERHQPARPHPPAPCHAVPRPPGFNNEPRNKNPARVASSICCVVLHPKPPIDRSSSSIRSSLLTILCYLSARLDLAGHTAKGEYSA